MSEAIAWAIIVPLCFAVPLAVYAPCLFGDARRNVFILAAICAAPAVVGLFIMAVAG
jgi:hypothetical protein